MARRPRPSNVLIRVSHPQAGEGWSYIDERELSREFYRDDPSEPIPYDRVKRHIAGAWIDKEYARKNGSTDYKGDPKPLITFDEWKGRQ